MKLRLHPALAALTLHAERVERLNLDGFKFTRVPGVIEPLVTTNVGKLSITP